jgi:AraC-like DNA-binding protein
MSLTHISQSAPPCPKLSEFVQCYAQRDIAVEDGTLSHSLLATLGPILVFELGDRSVLHFFNGKTKSAPRVQLFGSHASMLAEVRFKGNVLEFGIFLRPFACWQLFRIPPAEFAEVEFDAADVFGQWIQDLWYKLAALKSFLDRVRVANECLLPFAQNAIYLMKTMQTGRVLLECNASTTIRQVSFDSGMILRSYERGFSSEIGISPKLFARVARFQRAIDLKRASGDSWLSVAHEVGYFDQMHMVRDFRRIGGRVPGQLIHTIGDAQPWSFGPHLTKLHVQTRFALGHP